MTPTPEPAAPLRARLARRAGLAVASHFATGALVAAFTHTASVIVAGCAAAATIAAAATGVAWLCLSDSTLRRRVRAVSRQRARAVRPARTRALTTKQPTAGWPLWPVTPLPVIGLAMLLVGLGHTPFSGPLHNALVVAGTLLFTFGGAAAVTVLSNRAQRREAARDLGHADLRVAHPANANARAALKAYRRRLDERAFPESA